MSAEKTKGEKWLDRHDFVPGGQYMGNSHTLRYHEHGCTDIGKMNDEHKVETDNEQGLYRPCGHCHPGFGRYARLTSFRSSRDEPDDIKNCYDNKVAKIFEGIKCDCGASDGVIKMRPHEGGVRLLGDNHKMWIWRECYDCGHQLSLVHALQARKSKSGEI